MMQRSVQGHALILRCARLEFPNRFDTNAAAQALARECDTLTINVAAGFDPVREDQAQTEECFDLFAGQHVPTVVCDASNPSLVALLLLRLTTERLTLTYVCPETEDALVHALRGRRMGAVPLQSLELGLSPMHTPASVAALARVWRHAAVLDVFPMLLPDLSTADWNVPRVFIDALVASMAGDASIPLKGRWLHTRVGLSALNPPSGANPNPASTSILDLLTRILRGDVRIRTAHIEVQGRGPKSRSVALDMPVAEGARAGDIAWSANARAAMPYHRVRITLARSHQAFDGGIELDPAAPVTDFMQRTLLVHRVRL